MNTDPLAALRDIYLPSEPSWWPPAPGWWVLAIGLLLASLYLTYCLYGAWRQRAPIREALRLLQASYDELQQGHIQALQYLNQSNEILKRVLVKCLGIEDLGPEADEVWLRALDHFSKRDFFTQGAGRMLGNRRFAPVPEPTPTDLADLYATLKRLISALHPKRSPAQYLACRLKTEAIGHD